MTMPVPDHLKPEWHIWRVLSSPRFTVTLAELETVWSIDDLFDALDVLELFDALEQKQYTARK